MTQSINITIVPGRTGEPPMVRLDGAPVTADTDVALVARAALSGMAYVFTQGQPVQFGPEVPKDLLR